MIIGGMTWTDDHSCWWRAEAACAMIAGICACLCLSLPANSRLGQVFLWLGVLDALAISGVLAFILLSVIDGKLKEVVED